MGAGHSTAKASGALLGLAMGTFVYVTTETLPIGLLLLMSADLGVTPSAAGLLVTWYGLVVVVASLPLTQLTRRVPRRPLLSGLLGVFVLATWASAAASGYWVLLGARVVTALSQALFWAVVVPTAAGLFPPRLRGRVVAVVLGGGSLAAVLGLPLGTWLGQQAGWRAAHELYEETAARDARFRRIYESWRAYRDEQYQWFRVAENSYDNFAFPAAAQRQ